MPTVSIQGTSKTFEIDEGEVLYDALYDRGEVLPHGCLSGSCGACKVQIISGFENLQVPGAVEQDTIKSLNSEFELKDLRLACRAKVLGDVTIRIFKPDGEKL
jgi:ferredoxin